MPLAHNEANRLRGMIARVIATKHDYTQVCIAHKERDQGFALRLSLSRYQKALEKMNRYIDKLETTCPQPPESGSPEPAKE